MKFVKSIFICFIESILPRFLYRYCIMKRILVLFFCFGYNVLFAQQLKFSSGNNSWNADSLGNFRAIVRIDNAPDVIRSYIQWRRRDENPELKRIIVVDSSTNQKVLNVHADNITREHGEVYFPPYCLYSFCRDVHCKMQRLVIIACPIRI